MLSAQKITIIFHLQYYVLFPDAYTQSQPINRSRSKRWRHGVSIKHHDKFHKCTFLVFALHASLFFLPSTLLSSQLQYPEERQIVA